MNSTLDHELYEKARKRTKQKKRLYFHFVLFLIGSVFFVILNKILKIHSELDWYLWAIFAWLFIFLVHFNKVFIINRFFGKDWERVQTEKLIQKHGEKLDKLEAKLDKSGVLNKNASDS